MCSGHKRWTWSFTVDINPPGAPRKQVTRSGFTTKAEAQEAINRVQRAARTNEYVAPSSLTLSEYIENQWLPSVEPQLRPSTSSSYSDNLRLHVLSALGDIPLQTIEVVDVDRLYSNLLLSGRADGRGGLSQRTVRYIHTILNRLVKDAMRWQLVDRNVIDLATPPRHRDAQAQEMSIWSSVEVRKFLDDTSQHRLHPLFALAFATGLRRGEVVGLEWGDIDLNEGRMQVNRSIVSVGYQLIESPPKTASGHRRLAIDQETVAVLKRLRHSQTEERLASGTGWVATGRVFTRSDGTGVHPDRVSKVFSQLQENIGLPRITFHEIRHTWATLALRAGVHHKVVSERLGHSTVQTTLDIYSHVSEDLDREAAEAVAELLYG
jgi:integrase